MRKTREEKGITLIALIITIVVLLILAVVAINAVTGDGIIQHATNAKTSYENAQAKENSMISEYEDYLESHNPNKKIITFVCKIGTSDMWPFDLETYELKAEEGMTWYEWCKSKYNTVDFTCENEDSLIYNNWVEDNRLKKDLDATIWVYGKDVIIKGDEYKVDPNDVL